MTTIATISPPVPPGTGTLAVELDGVTKRFGAVTAVDGVSLQIRPGEVVALLGPNGAGKTTTIDMLLGLSGPSAGQVKVYGTRRATRWRSASSRPSCRPAACSRTTQWRRRSG